MCQLVFSSMGGSTIPLYISFAFLHLGIHVFLLSQEGPAFDTIEGLWIISCQSLLGHCNNLIFDYFSRYSSIVEPSSSSTHFMYCNRRASSNGRSCNYFDNDSDTYLTSSIKEMSIAIPGLVCWLLCSDTGTVRLGPTSSTWSGVRSTSKASVGLLVPIHALCTYIICPTDWSAVWFGPLPWSSSPAAWWSLCPISFSLSSIFSRWLPEPR